MFQSNVPLSYPRDQVLAFCISRVKCSEEEHLSSKNVQGATFYSQQSRMEEKPCSIPSVMV